MKQAQKGAPLSFTPGCSQERPTHTPPPAAPRSEYLVYVGLFMAFFGQLLATTGLLLLKRASIVEAELPFFRRPQTQPEPQPDPDLQPDPEPQPEPQLQPRLQPQPQPQSQASVLASAPR